MVANTMQGWIELFYVYGVLKQVTFLLEANLTAVQFQYIMKMLPQNESDVARFIIKNNEAFKLSQLQNSDLTVSDKIALFCNVYKLYKNGISYKVTPKDAGRIKSIQLTNELLEFYFTSDHWQIKDRQSISHLATYYNEVFALMKEKASPKPKFPNVWSKPFADKCEYEDFVQYIAHLKKLGFTPVYKNGTNQVVSMTLTQTA
jgi:hypothetical protein